MNIQRNWQKIKSELAGELFVVILLILVGTLSFGLGRLSTVTEGTIPVRILESDKHSSSAVDGVSGLFSETEVTDGSFVASKNSNKYHLPWCSGAQRIKDENKIWFSNEKEAESAGYTPAANCPGLE